MNLFEWSDTQGKQDYEALIKEIVRHNELYYAQAQSSISDAEYDKLYRQLEDMEAAHPEWISPHSPTQKVGNDLTSGFAKIEHALPMQSIDDIFEHKPEDAGDVDRELQAFYQQICRLLQDDAPLLSVEPKIDGCAVSLFYREGKLIYAATRGDGRRGDDITKNMMQVKSIPHQLPDSAPAVLELRGEVFMRQADFEALNNARDAAGLPAFANPRNVTAGTIKLLDAKEFATRTLDFICHGIGQYEGPAMSSTQDFIDLLKRMHLPFNQPMIFVQSLPALRDAVQQMNTQRHLLDYGTDGAVIKLSNFELREQLGSTARAPRWAAAYKFLPEQKETLLKDISIQVGRTGVLTPVAELEEVALSGTMVSRATLHNQDEIDRKDIRLGDTVLVEKAGEIIPAIVSVNVGKRPVDSQPYSLFKAVGGLCPSCHQAISQEEGQVAWRCTSFACPAQAVMRTLYFAKRECLDIANLGESVAEALVSQKLIKSPLGLFRLSQEQLASLNLASEESPRYLGEKNAAKIIAALATARQLPLERWVTAFGIAQSGTESSKELALYHQDLQELAHSRYLGDILQLEEWIGQYNALPQSTRYEEGAALRGQIEALAAPWQERAYLSVIRDGKTEKSKLKLKKSLGTVLCQKIVHYFNSSAGAELVQELRSLELNPRSAQYQENISSGSSGPLAGLTFVVTGSLSLPRPEFKRRIEAAGGKVTGSITGKTSYLLAGDGGGEKRQKAEHKGVPIIDEDTFERLLAGEF